MKHEYITALALPAAALFAFAAPVPEAAAQDQFTFTGRFDVDDLTDGDPRIVKLAYRCFVCESNEGESCRTNPSLQMGSNIAEFPLNGATSFHQNVSVSVDVDPGESPAPAEGFWCSMGYMNSVAPNTFNCFPQDPTSVPLEFIQSAENAPFTSQRFGGVNQ